MYNLNMHYVQCSSHTGICEYYLEISQKFFEDGLLWRVLPARSLYFTFWLFAYHQGMFAGNVTKIEFVCDLQEE